MRSWRPIPADCIDRAQWAATGSAGFDERSGSVRIRRWAVGSTEEQEMIRPLVPATYRARIQAGREPEPLLAASATAESMKTCSACEKGTRSFLGSIPPPALARRRARKVPLPSPRAMAIPEAWQRRAEPSGAGARAARRPTSTARPSASASSVRRSALAWRRACRRPMSTPCSCRSRAPGRHRRRTGRGDMGDRAVVARLHGAGHHDAYPPDFERMTGLHHESR